MIEALILLGCCWLPIHCYRVSRRAKIAEQNGWPSPIDELVEAIRKRKQQEYQG